ncbi:MAG: trypsin-like peptidase domain-containing protein, partial [Syntrophobacterales bacterium]
MQKGVDMRMGIARVGRFNQYESGLLITVTVLAFLLMSMAQTAFGAEEGVKPHPNGPISFAELVDEVKNEVVNISTTTVIKRGPIPSPFGQHKQFRDFFGDDFFERFFGQIPKERRQRSLGSGVVIDPQKGYILTNNHVVANAEEINVRLDDGKEHKAEVVGRDPKTDLALIKTEKP